MEAVFADWSIRSPLKLHYRPLLLGRETFSRLSASSHLFPRPAQLPSHLPFTPLSFLYSSGVLFCGFGLLPPVYLLQGVSRSVLQTAYVGHAHTSSSPKTSSSVRSPCRRPASATFPVPGAQGPSDHIQPAAPNNLPSALPSTSGPITTFAVETACFCRAFTRFLRS